MSLKNKVDQQALADCCVGNIVAGVPVRLAASLFRVSESFCSQVLKARGIKIDRKRQFIHAPLGEIQRLLWKEKYDEKEDA